MTDDDRGAVNRILDAALAGRLSVNECETMQSIIDAETKRADEADKRADLHWEEVKAVSADRMHLRAEVERLREAGDAQRGAWTMTHAELVARAVRWLRKQHRCSLVFAEIVTGAGESPDAIGWRMGLSRVVEVKVSRADFFRDRGKPHASHPASGMGSQRWYLMPAGLVSADEVPLWCGLAYAHARSIEVVREAPERERWDARGEAQVLTSAVRRLELGGRFDRGAGRIETYEERVRRQAAPAISEERGR